MPYASGRVIHDADAHIMEVPGFLTDHLEAKYRATITDQVLFPTDRGRGLHKLMDKNAGTDGDAVDETQIMLRKNWDALGSYSKADRPRSIDLLGFASQLMFTTQLLNFSALLEGKGDVDVIYAVARAHTRHMVGFCSVDKRLLATGYVPLADFELTKKTAREAIDAGAKALMIPSRCPDGHSPSHIGLDSLWGMAQEAGIPIVLHVGGGRPLLKYCFSSSTPPPPTCSTIGMPASCAIAHSGSRPIWLGEWPSGQRDGIINALAPASIASRAVFFVSSKSASGT